MKGYEQHKKKHGYCSQSTYHRFKLGLCDSTSHWDDR